MGTKSSTYGEKSEDQPSLENDSIPEAQPASKTVSTPRVRQRKHRSPSEPLAYPESGPAAITLKAQEHSDLSPAQRKRCRGKGLWRRCIKETGRASSGKETSQDQVALHCSLPFLFDEDVSDEEVPATTSGSPTSVTDGAVSDFAEVARAQSDPISPSLWVTYGRH